MAGSSFERTFEFKVNDTALKRATVRLFRSLERIEKKLDEIGGKGGKGFDAVAKGAEKAAASFKKVEAATLSFSKKSTRLREGLAVTGIAIAGASKGLDVLSASLQKMTGAWALAATKAKADTATLVAWRHGVLAAAAAHPVLTGSILAGVAAYTLFGSRTASVGKKLQQLTKGVYEAGAAVRKFIKDIKAPSGRGSELTIFDRIQSAKGGGLVGLRKLLDQVTAAQAKLISTNRGYVASSEKVRAVEKALSAELMARKKIMDQIIIGEQSRKPTSSLTAAAGEAGGLEGLKQLLSEAQGIQDRMLSTNENYKVATARVRNIQKAINQELRQRDLIMGKINIKEERSVSLGERLRGIGAKLGGQAVQAARPGRGMERRGVAAAGLGGLAGLGMFSNTAVGQGIGALGAKTMGFAGTAAGAGAKIGIPGMGLAAKGITDTKIALAGLGAAAKTVAAVNIMNPAVIAALGVAWVALGNKGIGGLIQKLIGTERAAKKTTAGLFGFAKANPVLSRLNMKLELSKDVVKKLGAAADETSKKLAGIGKNKGNIIQNIRASRAGRAKSGFAEWEESLRGTGTASARDAMVKSLERKNRRLVELGKEQLKGDRLINKEMKSQLKTSRDLEKSADRQQAKAKKRLENWKKIRGQKAENLMLGAGFPLLFGGGVGAVSGGVGGSILGNAMGMGGFGAQILGSAIGTMMETLVMKANALGEKLRDLNMEELNASGIKVNTQLALQIDKLRELGRLNEARVLAEIEVFKTTGALPGTHEAISGMVKELGDSWNRVSTTVGTTLGMIASPLLIALTKIMDLVNVIFGVVNAMVSVFAIFEKSMGELMMGSAKYRTHMWEASEAGKQARIEAERTLRAVEKEMKLRREVFMIDLRRPLENRTSEDKRANIALDLKDAIARADKVYQESLANLTRAKKLGGKQLDPGSDAYEKEAKAIFLVYNQALDDATKAELRAKAVLELQERRSIEKLERKLGMSKQQLDIHKKILNATKAGDTDTVARLNFESQRLSIIEKLGENLRANTDSAYQELLVKIAINDIEKARLTLSERLTENEQRVKALYEQIGGTIKDGLVNAIESAIEGTKTLGEVAASVFRQISRAFINFGISQAFGKGGLGLPGFAEGGSVGGGKPIVVGEKGPEIFTPGKSGYITPNNKLGGTSNVTINVDAGGSSMQGDAGQAGQLGRMLAAAVQDEMARQKRPGGILY